MERQRDLVLRWIEQIARLVARLAHGSGTPTEEIIEARAQITELVRGLLGGVAPLVPRMAVSSAAALLPDAERLWQYAQLLDLDAALLAALGEGDEAARQRARAVAFGAIAASRVPETPAEWREWLAVRRN